MAEKKEKKEKPDKKEKKKSPAEEKVVQERHEHKHEEKKERKPRCITCGVSVESERIWVEFKCPGCGKESIIRCEKCKRLENPYTCKGCGFTGP
jgi:predicted RNA-binding Zn-ribbon protein involved in translation (DUF1610 family)